MDMDMARQGLNDYFKAAIAQKVMKPAFMKEFLEPVFQKAGYREAVQPGNHPQILVVRDDAAGDFILFSPFLRELRRIYEGAQITLVCSKRNIDLARCCPYVDNIVLNGNLDSFDNATAALRGAIDVSIDLLEYNFDLAFSPRLGINSFSMLLTYLSGATQVVAFTNDRYSPIMGKVVEMGWDCLMTVPVPVDTMPRTDVERNLFMLEHLLKLPIANRQLELWMTKADMDKADILLKPLNYSSLIAAMPGSSLAMKQWPVERYVVLFKQILKENPNIGVVIMGGPEDKTVAKKMKKALGRRAISLAGKCSYRESAAVMSQLNMYIGNDTGLMHIAAACKVPILSVNCFPASLGLASMSIPVRFAPYMVPSVTCMPSQAADDCDNKHAYGCKQEDKPHCILNVSVELVMQGYRELLRRVTANNKEPMFLRAE